MTEPESEAESMSSDDDGIEFRVYYQDKDCIDIMIPNMKVRCKGCQKKFPFSKDAGVRMSDSPMVRSFYEHCLLQCPPFITSGQFLLPFLVNHFVFSLCQCIRNPLFRSFFRFFFRSFFRFIRVFRLFHHRRNAIMSAMQTVLHERGEFQPSQTRVCQVREEGTCFNREREGEE